ncbi:MAG: glycosyltransferase, partial [Phycisphaerae bacterium]|nr:glycosyltransferase [Phycisphaerae bacterium]
LLIMPRVTVIIPNYNHAQYLARRIESVLSQTFQDFDLILMDDASTDDSQRIIASYASGPRVRILLNSTNSGSTFKQWNKGIAAASGEYIWLAESDDYADVRFLEKLAPVLENNPNVGLVMCESRVIDEDDRVLRTTHDDVKFDVDATRWKRDFIANGPELCRGVLTAQNVVHNASAVLFRRSLYNAIGGADETMRVNGDWKLWAMMLMGSDLGHVADPLNFFRTHQRTVRVSSKLLISMSENLQVRAMIRHKMNAPLIPLRKTDAWLAEVLIHDWAHGTKEERRSLQCLFGEICRFDPGFRWYLVRRALERTVGRIIRGGRPPRKLP